MTFITYSRHGYRDDLLGHTIKLNEIMNFNFKRNIFKINSKVIIFHFQFEIILPSSTKTLRIIRQIIYQNIKFIFRAHFLFTIHFG